METLQSKGCLFCGRRMEPKRNEYAERFVHRKYCSVDCKNGSLRRVKFTPPKRCECCGGWFSKNPQMSSFNYSLQKCCSSKCGRINKARRAFNI